MKNKKDPNKEWLNNCAYLLFGELRADVAEKTYRYVNQRWEEVKEKDVVLTKNWVNPGK